MLGALLSSGLLLLAVTLLWQGALPGCTVLVQLRSGSPGGGSLRQPGQQAQGRRWAYAFYATSQQVSA